MLGRHSTCASTRPEIRGEGLAFREVRLLETVDPGSFCAPVNGPPATNKSTLKPKKRLLQALTAPEFYLAYAFPQYRDLEMKPKVSVAHRRELSIRCTPNVSSACHREPRDSSIHLSICESTVPSTAARLHESERESCAGRIGLRQAKSCNGNCSSQLDLRGQTLWADDFFWG